jgi:hypothetical protein
MPFITYSCVDQYIGNCRCRSGTLSTLRFGERAKLMPNKPVINEISEDDVNGLSDQIRQLKVHLRTQKHVELPTIYTDMLIVQLFAG